ncbi:MAG: hypothetical protein ACFCVG_05440 [Kineosporiaceae bacterium]
MLPFTERRGLGALEWAFLAVQIPIVAAIAWVERVWEDDRGWVIVLFGPVPALIVMAVWAGPWGNLWKHNRVTAERASFGPYLRVDPRHLGQVDVIVDHVERANMLLRVGSRRIAWFGTTVGWGDRAAVLVERRIPASARPYWLIGTSDPQALAAALRGARRSARDLPETGPAHGPRPRRHRAIKSLGSRP